MMRANSAGRTVRSTLSFVTVTVAPVGSGRARRTPWSGPGRDGGGGRHEAAPAPVMPNLVAYPLTRGLMMHMRLKVVVGTAGQERRVRRSGVVREPGSSWRWAARDELEARV
jgi:hypothetical protein